MWFCLKDGQSFGPFSTQEAQNFLRTHPRCLVWKEGMPEWVPAHNFDQLSSAGAQVLHPSLQTTLETQLDFTVCGDDMQYVEIALKPGESVISEPGAMIFKEPGIDMEAQLGSGRKQGLIGKIISAGKRTLTGEKLFLSCFYNDSDDRRRVAFSAPYPGKIIPVSLKGFGGEVICQKESFLCAESDIDIGIFFQKRIFTALFGGGGFIMQRLSGDGVVFIHAGGMIREYDLDEGDSLQVDAGCLVAFQPSVGFDLREAGNLKAQLFGGSGLFFANLCGPGKVWVQSLPFSRLAQRLFTLLPEKRK